MTAPRLDDLMASFLARRAEAASAGAEFVTPPIYEEHDAVPSYAVDVRQAWTGAVDALVMLAPGAVPSSRIPSGWSALVISTPKASALPIAIGNFPQAVRDVELLLQCDSSSASESRDQADEGMSRFIDVALTSDEPQSWLLAIGMLRATNRINRAERMLSEKSALAHSSFHAAFENERAAMNWSRGNRTEAMRQWATLPDSAPVFFNRGMAELFAGSAAQAVNPLRSAVAAMPETSGWHHLACLYLTVAESR